MDMSQNQKESHMTNMINYTVKTNAMNKLKTELVKETIQSLFMIKSNQFDLSTERDIQYAVNCAVDNLLQQKIKNGEIQVIEQSNSHADSNEVMQ